MLDRSFEPRCCNPVCIFSAAFPDSEVARSALAVTLSNVQLALSFPAPRPWTEPLSKQKIPVIALVLSNGALRTAPASSKPAF